MTDGGRVVTAKLPEDLAMHLDEVSTRIERTKSWIMREAVALWLEEEERRFELTMEAIESMEAGASFSQEEAEAHFAEKRSAREKKARAA